MATNSAAPGPTGSGLWGVSPLDFADPLGALADWARKYGDVLQWRTLSIHSFLLSHPDDIETVLVTQSQKFLKGRILQLHREALGNGLLTSEGSVWLQQRRLMQPTFHRERVLDYVPAMVARAAQEIAGWGDGQTLDIYRESMRITLEISTETLFGTYVPEDTDRVRAALDVLLATPSRYFVLLRGVPTAANLRYSGAVAELERFVYNMIERRRAEGTEGADDLLSRLLEAEDENGQRMSDNELRDQCITLLVAGHETTALALTWATYLVAQHPFTQEKLFNEVDVVLGGRSPAVSDLPRLIYAESVIRESLRLYPPISLMPRLANEDCDLREYRIPKGASVSLSQWVVHRDARWFAEPQRFYPERWTEDFARALPRFAYFPFGGGTRLCIGANFAIAEAVLLLAVIAQRFRLALANSEPVEPLPTVTLRPKGGVWLTLSRR